MDCIFCKIIAGNIPARKIYEDEDVMAFLDVNPISQGHTLIVPKKHTLDIKSINNDALIKIFEIARKIGTNVMDKLEADGYSLVQNNGIAQEVKHFHLHVIPRYKEEMNIDIDSAYDRMAK